MTEWQPARKCSVSRLDLPLKEIEEFGVTLNIKIGPHNCTGNAHVLGSWLVARGESDVWSASGLALPAKDRRGKVKRQRAHVWNRLGDRYLDLTWTIRGIDVTRASYKLVQEFEYPYAGVLEYPVMVASEYAADMGVIIAEPIDDFF
jgi:hypothetical protein